MESKHLSFDTAALSDMGRVRSNNEDRVFAVERTRRNALGAESVGIYMVADGMGGHQAGEVASGMALRIISKTLLESLEQQYKSLLPVSLVKRAIEKANKEIIHLAGCKKELYSMGTTVTLGFRLDNTLCLGHVGDSRAYLIRKAGIEQLTEDHSLVARLLKARVITSEEATRHPERGIIFRCLGASDNIVIDTTTRKLSDGDSLVFCSDGLTAHVREDEISKCVRESRCANEACEKLVELANSRGGQDNTSVIVVNMKLK